MLIRLGDRPSKSTSGGTNEGLTPTFDRVCPTDLDVGLGRPSVPGRGWRASFRRFAERSYGQGFGKGIAGRSLRETASPEGVSRVGISAAHGFLMKPCWWTVRGESRIP